MMALRVLADRLDAALPQTQCTRCGYPTCRAYAQAIANDEADIDRCPPGGAAGVDALARLLGRASKPLDSDHGIEQAPIVALIDEDLCIGCTKCIQACPVDAIVGAAKRMHTIIASECTGCELCLPPCPVDCIALVPIAQQPLQRVQVLARAAHARERFESRNLRLAGKRRRTSATAVTDAASDAIPAASISPQSAAVERPISRSAVLEAIARGKARQRKDPPPQ